MAEQEAPVSLSLRSEQLRLNESISQLLRAAAALRPTVVLLEDLHWADEATLELLEFLTRIPDLAGVLVCVTWCDDEMGEEDPLAVLKGEQVTRVPLDNLSVEHTEQLVRSMLGLEQLPAGVTGRIQHVTGGNTFFIQELIRSLAEDGQVLQRTTSGWQVDEDALHDASLPESIRQVILRRMGRLLPDERELLEWAAVVGQVFWEGAVVKVAPFPRQQVREGLQDLVHRGLIVEHEPAAFAGEREYVFENATLQHVAYERVPTVLQPRCHLWVAEWMAGRDERRVDEYADLIADHYEKAGEGLKAARWYIRAGKQARSAFAPQAAIRYFHRALHYLPSLEEATAEQAAEQFPLYDDLVEVLRWQGRFVEALETAEQMHEAAKRMGDAAALAQAHRDFALVHDRLGDYAAALEHADRAEEIARAAGEAAQLELSNAFAMKGWIYYRLGEAEAALKAAHQALEASMALGSHREVALSLNLLGALYDMRGDYEAAVRYGEEALRGFRELGDRHLVGSVLNNLGENARLRGDYEAAVAYYEESLTVAQRTGSHSLEVLLLNNLGGARVGLGEYEAAEQDLRQVIEGEESASWFLPETYRFLARACMEQGKLEEALAAGRQALKRGLEGGNQEFVGAAWRVLGRIAARRGEAVPVEIEGERRPCDAVACFSESARIFRESGMEGERGRTLQAWAAYELEHGDRERGEAMQREAQALFERLGMVDGC